MKHKVLVTGGTGFVGFYIVQRLAENGYDVTVLARTENKETISLGSSNPNIRIKIGDLTDFNSLEEACIGQDIIVHAAAIISFDPSDRKKIFKVNIDGTTHLINAAIKSSVKKFIYISSIAAISDLPDQTDHDEIIPWDLKTNHSNYAISKHAAEMEVWRGSAEGLEIGILNPSVVLGNWNENHHSVQIFKIIKEGISFYPTGSTGWVDVRDVALATQVYIENEIVNQQIIINGHNLSYQNVINMIATGYSLKPPSYKLSRRIALIGGRIYGLANRILDRKHMIQSSMVKAVYKNATYNNSKSKELLGMKYTSMDKTIEWIINQKPI